MDNYTGFVYLWRDKKRKMFYLGSHKGSINDGYIGSGRRFKNHYNSRPYDFRRRILEYVNGSVYDIWRCEEKWLSMIKPSELGTRYTNLKLTAKGGAGPRSAETKLKISQTTTGRVKWTEEQKSEISKRQIGVPKSNGPACSRAKKGKKVKPFSDTRKTNITKGKYKRILCDGLEFESGQHAAKHFGIAVTTVSARLRNKNFADWFMI